MSLIPTFRRRGLRKQVTTRATLRLGWVAGFALLLGGCIPSPGSPPVATVDASGIPAVVVNRSVLPPCGFETTTQSGGFNIAGRRCLWDAYLGRRPAEFVSTRPTVEGDPITFIFRVLGDGRVEVFEDQTHDRFSLGGWLHLDCPGLSIDDASLGQPAFAPGMPGPSGECAETPIG
jgi:hypothetical protein